MSICLFFKFYSSGECLLTAIDLIDEEPHWRTQLADNVAIGFLLGT